MKKLKEYFESTKGSGVLASADSSGKVDAAIYLRPHFLEEGTLAFIMRDRLSHHNLQSSPHATFLFEADGDQGTKNGSFGYQAAMNPKENANGRKNQDRRQCLPSRATSPV